MHLIAQFQTVYTCILRLCLVFIFSLFFTAKLNGEEKVHEVENVHDIVIVPLGKTIQGDCFTYGDTVEISGTIEGDLYVCGGQIFIDGQVLGDVLAAGGNVDIQGEVKNNVRVIAAQTMIGGKIGRNATIISGNTSIASAAEIEGNLVCCAGNVELAGKIGSTAHIAASNLRISGQINDNLEAYVGQLRLTSRALVGGNVEYRSNTVAYIDPETKIMGSLTQHPSLIQGLFKGRFFQKLLVGSKIAGLLMNFFYTIVVGIILMRVFPGKLERALEALEKRPWKSVVLGTMLLILLPLASLVLLMTILGIPFALTLLALNIIGFYTAKVFTICWGANAAFTPIGLKKNRMTTFSLGVVCYFVITAIPYLGKVVALAAMLFGLGAGVFGQSKKF